MSVWELYLKDNMIQGDKTLKTKNKSNSDNFKGPELPRLWTQEMKYCVSLLTAIIYKCACACACVCLRTSGSLLDKQDTCANNKLDAVKPGGWAIYNFKKSRWKPG